MVANGDQAAGIEWSNLGNVGAGPATAAASGAASGATAASAAAETDRPAPPAGGQAHRGTPL